MATEYEIQLDQAADTTEQSGTEIPIEQAVDTTESSGTQISLSQPVNPKAGLELSLDEVVDPKDKTIDVTPEEAPLELKTS